MRIFRIFISGRVALVAMRVFVGRGTRGSGETSRLGITGGRILSSSRGGARRGTGPKKISGGIMADAFGRNRDSGLRLDDGVHLLGRRGGPGGFLEHRDTAGREGLRGRRSRIRMSHRFRLVFHLSKTLGD